ncbi:hypothetical protein H0H93_014352 [Arthromyces matolae]|nr:hypothetical protein H0H93_014352 [Arthromyces matolae]
MAKLIVWGEKKLHLKFSILIVPKAAKKWVTRLSAVTFKDCIIFNAKIDQERLKDNDIVPLGYLELAQAANRDPDCEWGFYFFEEDIPPRGSWTLPGDKHIPDGQEVSVNAPSSSEIEGYKTFLAEFMVPDPLDPNGRERMFDRARYDRLIGAFREIEDKTLIISRRDTKIKELEAEVKTLQEMNYRRKKVRRDYRMGDGFLTPGLSETSASSSHGD